MLILLSACFCEAACLRTLRTLNYSLPHHVRHYCSEPINKILPRSNLAPWIQRNQHTQVHEPLNLEGYQYDPELDLLYKLPGNNQVIQEERFPLPGVIRDVHFKRIAELSEQERKKIVYGITGMLRLKYETLGEARGSAFLIYPDMILTAAHNILCKELGNKKNVAKEKVKQAFFYIDGLKIPISESACMLPDEWINGFHPDYDFSVIFLQESLKLTDKVILTSSAKEGEDCEVVGFPGAVLQNGKKLENSDGSMYASPGKISLFFPNKKRVQYDNSTYGGNSGGPVAWGADLEKILAVHTFGSAKYNGGVHLVDHFHEYLKKWVEKKDKGFKQTSFDISLNEIFNDLAKTQEELDLLQKYKARFSNMSTEHLTSNVQLFLDGLRIKLGN